MIGAGGATAPGMWLLLLFVAGLLLLVWNVVVAVLKSVTLIGDTRSLPGMAY